MNKRIVLAAASLLLACCESLPIPTSTSEEPAASAPRDASCMQDCLGDGADPALCHSRCAK